MKKFLWGLQISPLVYLTAVIILFAVLSSCEKEKVKDCTLILSLSPDYSGTSLYKKVEALKSGGSLSIPDTNDFILSIKDGSGNIIYDGSYGERPEKIMVSSGVYDISIVSRAFDKPAFNAPQFGDSKQVVIGAGETVITSFMCRQLNSGMQVKFSNEFIERYESAKVVLTSAEQSIDYPYSENRIAFFNPGRVEMHIQQAENNTFVLSRELRAAEILTINLAVSANENGNAGLKVEVDTTRTWYYENFIVGEGNDGSTKEKAFTVAEAKNMDGAANVWVKGYIVGGDLSSSSVSFTPPFTKNSNLAISDNYPEDTRQNCFSVEIPSAESIRTYLNLVDNPSNIGKMVYLKGTINPSYQGLVGLKSLKEFKFE